MITSLANCNATFLFNAFGSVASCQLTSLYIDGKLEKNGEETNKGSGSLLGFMTN